MIKLFIIDDHTVLASSLAKFIDDHSEKIHVVGYSDNYLMAKDTIDFRNIDILLLDIEMPIMDGFQVCQEIKTNHPHVRVMFLTQFTGSAFDKKAKEVGASAMLSKSIDAEDLFRDIERAHNGECLLQFKGDTTLTPRELEILNLISQGKKSRDIASKLYLSVKTIETHRKNMIGKAGVNNAAELVAFGFKKGLLV